jgi:hypothetical protein
MSSPKSILSPPDSTGPGVASTLANLSPISRCVLTCLRIDPTLARPAERDRLRILVSLTGGNPGNDAIGRGYHDIHELWRRGFPVPAFDDTLSKAGIDEARHRITAIRINLGTAWQRPQAELAHLIRLVGLLRCELRPRSGPAPLAR